MTTMARTLAAALIFGVAASSTWASQPPVISKADERRLQPGKENFEKGRKELARVAEATTRSRKLYALDRAATFLRRARTTALKSDAPPYLHLRANVDEALVDALNGQTEIYIARSSLRQAEKRNTEALSIAPRDLQARIYTDLITEAKSSDLWTDYQGTIAIERIRDRRADFGLPIRDRGVSRRR